MKLHEGYLSAVLFDLCTTRSEEKHPSREEVNESEPGRFVRPKVVTKFHFQMELGGDFQPQRKKKSGSSEPKDCDLFP